MFAALQGFISPQICDMQRLKCCFETFKQQTANQDSTGLPWLGCCTHTLRNTSSQAAGQSIKLATIKGDQSAGEKLSVLPALLFTVDPMWWCVALLHLKWRMPSLTATLESVWVLCVHSHLLNIHSPPHRSATDTNLLSNQPAWGFLSLLLLLELNLYFYLRLLVAHRALGRDAEGCRIEPR